MALSDQAQAAIMLLALMFIAIGGIIVTAPQAVSQLTPPLNDYVGLAFILIGAIGAALKEYLGIKPTNSTTATKTA